MTLPRILLITPFRNEGHSLKYYFESLHNLDYPPELIDVYWFENDSTDNTMGLLQAAEHDYSFNSLTLSQIRILGPVKKRPPGEYWKDIGYGPGRIRPWLVLWNDVFFPLFRESDHDYVLMWYADAVAPPNVIHEYLKVVDEHPVGWVGGSLARREPKLSHITFTIESPWPRKRVHASKPVRCKLTGHVWLMPRAEVADCSLSVNLDEVHLTIIECLAKKGLYVYYQPSVYLQHVSTDGKIHHPEMPWK